MSQHLDPSWIARAAAGLALALAPSVVIAQTEPVGPTTAPVGAATVAPAVAPVVDQAATEPTDFRQKLRDAFSNLDLSDDQKLTLSGLFQEAKEQAQQLRKDHAQDSPIEQAMRRRHFLEDLRAKTDAVLTPEQRKQVAPAWQTIAVTPSGTLTRPTTRPASLVATTQLTQPHPPPLATVSPAAPPTTAPAPAPPTPSVVRRPVPRALPRLQAALAQLTLTDTQHQQIAGLMADTQQQLVGLDPGDRAAKAKQISQTVRSRLREILTPDQLSQLRAAIRAGAESEPPAASPVAATPVGEAPSQQADPKLLPRGTPAPPFVLYNLDGDRVTLSQFHGRVLALVFGSYTSPVFRDRAASLQRLWRANDADDKAALFIVYTREAHPTDGWQVERNKTDHVLLAQTTTVESRRAAATQCRSALHLSIPMLLDSTDDAVSTAYGAFPDGAVVIDRAGTVTSAQHWAEPAALQHAIDEAAKQVATTRP